MIGCNSYKISNEDADQLKGLFALPTEMRIELLTHTMWNKSRQEILELFAQFMGLCKSVEENTAEMTQEYLVINGLVHPHDHERLNTPSIFGALMGIGNAVEPTEGMCDGCAYRLGTKANQARTTSLDAEYSADGGCKFSCHHDLDEAGNPTRICAGYAKKCAENGVEVQR